MTLDRTVNAAPMMGRTDRHCRYFLRGFSARMLLYTEMIPAADLTGADCARLLEFDPEEHPIALQLGGCVPQELAAAARRGEQAGYDEINLNCGCPSDRTTGGEFGAYLMHRPETVATCVAAMRAAVRVPVTVKMRIGVIEGRGRPAIEASRRFDDAERAALVRFVGAVRDAGCDAVIVHARKAVLGGLSAQENRVIPPLQYDVVTELKKAFADLPVVERQLARGEKLSAVVRHIQGLYAGEPGAHEFRRTLKEGARRPGAGAEVLAQAVASTQGR